MSSTSKKKMYISQEQWSMIMAQAWEDDDFRQALEKDPREALKNHPVFDKHAFADWEVTHVLKIPEPPKHLDGVTIEKIASGAENALAIPYTCSC